ncbi:hypothetical protein BS50DRAFT_616347 [Corynespora cassiicola Philippines]|uniref:Zn(2)-C6 fungal-type domain-containing protein n=1 Tax=Corynespora cassiicola Philippines TaxID=1448308 RepID=A0A2T2P656_CORCC|nr:hypothetical protein BS50DRAFT_616347 [Corynespora cassiicola Philippines]
MQEKQKKRTRASHPKVRTGCHTCKARRVKCDEKRPACLKCVHTGRKCEGYQDNREWVVIVAPPPPVTDGFDDDRSRRHFDYFRSQAVYEISWFFDGNVWGPLVLKEAHASAAVRHAVIALSCSHEDFGDSLTHADQSPQFAYAAQHYSKAMRNLIKETSDNTSESRMRALICGLLFIAIEVLRGNNVAARHHLNACLKIVKEAQEKMGTQYVQNSPHPLEKDRLEVETHLTEGIIPMFARLDIQGQLILGGTPQTEMTPIVWSPSSRMRIEKPPLRFESVIPACNSILLMSNDLHSFMMQYSDIYRVQCVRPIPVEVTAQKVSLYKQFSEWDYAVRPMIKTITRQRDRDKITLMRVYNRTAITLLENSLDIEECYMDNFHWVFRELMDFVAELRERPYNSDEESDSDTSVTSLTSVNSDALSFDRWTRPFFALDHCIIFALYWTALKCRDGALRRRAIPLLEISRQEGIWSGPISAAIAKRVIELEEGEPYRQYPPAGQLKRAKDIPEYVRIHSVRTDIDKLRRQAKLVIMRRPNGDEGGWHESVEWVSW